MNKLIDQERLLTDLKKKFGGHIGDPIVGFAVSSCINTVEEQPEVDAVQVVRCKDCKYYDIWELKRDYTADKRHKPSVCIHGEFAVHRSPTWFCADGKRREADGTE